MAWFVLERHNGVLHPSVYFDDPRHYSRYKQYGVSCKEISWVETEFPLAILMEIYNREKPDKGKTLDTRLSKIAKELAGIIRTSHHKGERETARKLYQRATGEAYTGPEYQD